MAERKNSEARIRSNNKWTNANYDRINIAVPKGRKAEVQARASISGQSVNGYIVEAISEKLERDGGGTPGESVMLPDTLALAKEAAEKTGEEVPQFVARAVETQAKRDVNSLQMGINPASPGTEV